MDMRKYMTFEAVLERYEGMDPNTRTSKFGDPEDIKVFKYGKDIFIRGNTSATTVTAQVYLSVTEIKVKDRLDGQVVKSVNHYPESWNSSKILYEALTWED